MHGCLEICLESPLQYPCFSHPPPPPFTDCFTTFPQTIIPFLTPLLSQLVACLFHWRKKKRIKPEGLLPNLPDTLPLPSSLSHCAVQLSLPLICANSPSGTEPILLLTLGFCLCILSSALSVLLLSGSSSTAYNFCYNTLHLKRHNFLGLPWMSNGWVDSAFQCRECGPHPWSQGTKILHAAVVWPKIFFNKISYEDIK